MSSPRRLRPDRPYRKIPVRRLLMECNRRLAGARGPRAFELVAALVERWPRIQSGIVYLGDERMGQAMTRCSRTAHRAKYDLAKAGLVVLHGAGPRRCPCSKCGGEKAGGTIHNARGEPVSAATGYELDPGLFTSPRPPDAARRGRPSRSDYLSPAELRVRAAGQAKLASALENLRAPRAGP